MEKILIRKKQEKRINIQRIFALVLIFMIVMITIISIIEGAKEQTHQKIASQSIVEYKEVEVACFIDKEEQVVPPSEDIIVEEKIIPMYTTTGVNIRIEPNCDCGVYKTVSINTEIQKVENSDINGWNKIKMDNNYYYIYSKYLSDKKTEIKIARKENISVSSRGNAGITGNLIGYYTLTYYCPCYQCCGKTNGITAWGTVATAGRTIAAPKSLAFGTKLSINEHIYTVEDRGGAINGNRIDVYVNSHSEALKLGVKKNVPVYKI